MPWTNTPEKRRRDQETYGNREYRANRKVVLARAAGRCELCGTSLRRLQVDHVIPVSQGGGHDLGNLRALCSGPGSVPRRENGTRRRRLSAPETAAGRPDPQPRTAW